MSEAVGEVKRALVWILLVGVVVLGEEGVGEEGEVGRGETEWSGVMVVVWGERA